MINLASLVKTCIATIQQHINNFGKTGAEIEFELTMAEVKLITGTATTQALNNDIESAVQGIVDRVQLYPNSIVRQKLADRVRMWALSGHDAQWIRDMLPVYVEGIKDVREYGL